MLGVGVCVYGGWGGGGSWLLAAYYEIGAMLNTEIPSAVEIGIRLDSEKIAKHSLCREELRPWSGLGRYACTEVGDDETVRTVKQSR